MIYLIGICLAAYLWLLLILRKEGCSLGLPAAYLFSLLLIHVPGAFIYAGARSDTFNAFVTEISMRFTAVGVVCFVAGTWLARSRSSTPGMQASPVVEHTDFCRFCLLGGWFVTYGLSPLYRIPSIAAVADKGGGIWMLGVMLGLRAAAVRGDFRRVAFWLGALVVYPTLMLLLGGFLSYGAAAAIVVLSALAISTRHYWRVVVSLGLISFLGLSLFVNYMRHRTDIRKEVWGGAPLAARIDSTVDMFRNFEWIDLSNKQHQRVIDDRLNQNYFAGMAALRIQQGLVDYLWGRSVWEGVLSLVPRALWPEKPVYGGSPKIVAEMTGLVLSATTSFGVGNVMEFQINFGFPGVIGGFFLLGWIIGTLDLKASVAERRGDLGRLLLYFLPCVALIQPGGSIVELTGGSAAALAAAYGWKWAWKVWSHKRAPLRGSSSGRFSNASIQRVSAGAPGGDRLARIPLPREH
ncbi:MAG TPA: hypothetical protein VE959_23655 [Bryobacteraceae bacterium]|nr:hypothetical protein [Bryobacteraceae bacterium]